MPPPAADQPPTRTEIDATTGLIVVEFGAAWCGHCRALAPWLAACLLERPDIQRINVEDGPGLPLGRSYGVKLWPTLVFLRDGVAMQRLVRPSVAELRHAFRDFGPDWAG